MPRVLAQPALEELAAGRPARPAPAGLARLAASVGNAAFARLARQAAPARERTNLVFIMRADAHDRPGGPANHFYALAREYAARWHGTIVDAPRYRTLAGSSPTCASTRSCAWATSTSSPTPTPTATSCSRWTSATPTAASRTRSPPSL